MIDRIRVEPGHRPNFAHRDPRDTLGLADKAETKAHLGELVGKLERLQRRLYAEAERSILLVLQGLDASGKDGVIRAVFEGVNPQGCSVRSFKGPTSTELAHDYLWRIHAVLAERGAIGIFNRSRRARPLRRLHGCLRGAVDGDVHRLGAVVRRAGRPELGEGARRRDAARPHTRDTRPAAAGPGGGHQELQVTW